MKILHLNINEQFGGAAQAANRLHHELLRMEVDSNLLVINKESNDKSVIRIAGVYSKGDKLKLFIRKAFNIIKVIFHNNRDKRYNPPSLLLGVIRRMDFDILHLHWVTGSFVNFRELINIKKPIVWTMHDCAAFTGICNVIGNCNNYQTGCGNCPLINSKSKKDISSREFKRKQKLYKYFNFNLVSPSHWIAENASMSPLLKGQSISIIPHGLDTDLFRPLDKLVARKVFNLNSTAKIILFGAVTLIDDNKGIQYLIDALKQISVSETEKNEIELLLFGENPNGIFLFGVKTTNLGYISDARLLRIVYSLADVMIVPSRQESFGQTAIEAMSCGTPVVAFGATGLLDIVDHKKNGYLAIPYEADDLANGIKWCLSHNTQNELSDNARLKVLECFNINMVAEKYKKLYNKILSQ